MSESNKRGRPKKAPPPPPKPLTKREEARAIAGLMALNDLVFMVAYAPKTVQVITLFKQYEAHQKKAAVGSLSAADQQEMDGLHEQLKALDVEMRAKKRAWNQEVKRRYLEQGER